MTLQIRELELGDRPQWEALARGYKDFYNTPTSDTDYEQTWLRLLAAQEVFGLGASLEGRLVGIAHYMFHASAWAPAACYLQDLFTDASARGGGVATALISAVATRARQQGSTRFYWLTQEHNAVARRLYDRLAQYRGFVRYDYVLQPPSI